MSYISFLFFFYKNLLQYQYFKKLKCHISSHVFVYYQKYYSSIRSYSKGLKHISSKDNYRATGHQLEPGDFNVV